MKLARFIHNGSTRIGKVDGDSVIDLSGVRDVPALMRDLLGRLPELRPALEAATGPTFPLSDVTLEAPINDPQKCLTNDASVRDWQQKSPTFRLGKSWDTHGPIGDYIRQYSLVGISPDGRSYRIGVLREDTGRGGARFV